MAYPTTEQTVTVSAANRDVSVYYDSAAWQISTTENTVGHTSAAKTKQGIGMVFDVPTPVLMARYIVVSAYLVLTAKSTSAGIVTSRVTCNMLGNYSAPNFTNLGTYQAFRGTIVGGADDSYLTDQVAWNIPITNAESTATSPDISSIVQSVVNQSEWNNFKIGVWLDDHLGEEATDEIVFYSYSDDPTKAPKLVITYEIPGFSPIGTRLIQATFRQFINSGSNRLVTYSGSAYTAIVNSAGTNTVLKTNLTTGATVNYAITDSPISNWLLTVDASGNLWTFIITGGSVLIRKYTVGTSTLTSVYNGTYGAATTTLIDAIMLASGNILLATRDTTTKDYYFTEIQSDGTQITTTVAANDTFAGGTLAIHPADNNVWFFYTVDGQGISAIRFSEAANEVTLVTHWSNATDVLILNSGGQWGCHNEWALPQPIVVGSDLFIAYQNDRSLEANYVFNDSWGSQQRQCYHAIQEVATDGTLTQQVVIAKLTATLNTPAVMYYSGHFYLGFIYAGAQDHQNRDIYYVSDELTETRVGVHAPTVAPAASDMQSSMNATIGSSQYLMYENQYDGYIYFHNLGVPAPTVTDISPVSGYTPGGDAVTITGTGFLTGATVTIGGHSATSVVFVNSTTITAVTPADTTGAKDIVVTNPDAQIGTLVSGYEYLTVTTPTVTCQTVTIVNPTSATGNGNVADDGGATITDRGICWKATPGAQITDSHVHVAGTTGAFTGAITGLDAETKYYVNSFATNSEGTEYGTEVDFTTSSPEAENTIGLKLNSTKGRRFMSSSI